MLNFERYLVVFFSVIALTSSCKILQTSGEIDDSYVRPVVTEADVRILLRADEILTNENVWDKKDTRD